MAPSEGPAGPTEVLIKKLLNSYRRHGLGGSERSAWVDHVVTHAGDPGSALRSGRLWPHCTIGPR